jgi:thymidylate synthase
MKLIGVTIDDLLRQSIESIMSSGSPIKSSRGPNTEVLGAYLELSDPRARLCQAENRSTLYSCLGELLWYLAASDELAFMEHYVPTYREFVEVDEHGRVPTAYGPRLFSWDGIDQFKEVTERLQKSSSTRQATLQIFDRRDLVTGKKDVPCTCFLQFLCRDNQLHLITSMRSNDVIRGLPTDVFAFTMIQEIVARTLSLELGSYRHFAGSFHLYEEDIESARRLLAEGWQQTVGASMKPMPQGNPWPAINEVLRAERAYRTGTVVDPWTSLGDPYWDQIVWLLEMHRHSQAGDLRRFEQGLSRSLDSYFDRYIQSRLKRLKGDKE